MKRKTLCLILASALVIAALCFIFWPRGGEIVYNVNLLKNPGFEDVTGEGLPKDWYTDAYNNVAGYTDYETVSENGNTCALLRNNGANDARYAQTVSVEPGAIYRLSAKVRANATGGRGANVSVEGVYVFSESPLDTQGEWTEISLCGMTGPDQRSVTVFVRLGGYGGESEGEAAFDDVSLVRIKDVPKGENLTLWYSQEASAPAVDTQSGEPSAFWPWLLVLSLIYVLLCAILRDRRAVWLGAILLAVALRFLIAALVPGYDVDIGCFRAWSARMAQVGPASFYDGGGFSDYPPGYMLILWLIGLVTGGDASAFMVKLPPILFDLLCGFFLFKAAKEEIGIDRAGLLTAIYLLNPLVLVTGAAWGQADGVMACFLLLAVWQAVKGKWRFALPLYALSALCKPQALMFGPLGMAALVICLIRNHQKENVKDALIGLGATALVFLAVVLPFSVNLGGLGWLVSKYSGTMTQYNYASVNAFNLYFLFGLNWVPAASRAPTTLILCAGTLAALPGGLMLWKGGKGARPYAIALLCAGGAVMLTSAFAPALSTFGNIMIALSAGAGIYLYVKAGDPKTLPFFGALSLLLIYTFGTMMHERYLFPAIILLALAYALQRDKRILLLMLLCALPAFINVGIGLDRNIRIGGAAGHLTAPMAGIITESGFLEYASSLFICLTAAFGLWLGFDLTLNGAKEKALNLKPASAKRSATRFTVPAIEAHRMKRADALILAGITLCYAVLAFANLGSLKAPQNPWVSKSADESVTFSLGSERTYNVLFYGGIHHTDYYFAFSDGTQDAPASEMQGDCFRWKYACDAYGSASAPAFTSLPVEFTGDTLTVTAKNIGLTLMEIIVRDAETGERIDLTLLSGAGENLIDEQDTLKGEPGWYNGMYFDEIYHARTGYEHLHGLSTYETSHPPLGKLCMSLFISIFGMTPFGWRFAGALAGVLMLPAMYLMGRMLFKRRCAAMLPCLLMALDTLHFTQTRIATIDSFVVLFILWSGYFMLRWALLKDKTLLKSLLPLLLSGLFMGFSIASKWTGCYAAVGIAVIFFFFFFRKWKEGEDRQRLLLTLPACVLFFVILPLTIYYLSYIPYFASSGGVTVQKVIDAAESMLRYHSKPGLGMDHPYYSPWYQWPLSLRNMWYAYDSYAPAGMAGTIVAFGNLIVWIGGLIALLMTAAYAVWMAVQKRELDVKGCLLIVFFLAQFLPWILVPRGTYIYHYFASVPFLCLCAGLWVDRAPEKAAKWISGCLIALAAAYFIAFYPYASGMITPYAWLEAVKPFSSGVYYYAKY